MAYKFKTCLITGGAGFIGRTLLAKIAKLSKSVVIVDNFHPQIHKYARIDGNVDSNVRVIRADVCVKSDWDKVLSEVRPEIVIHLAAETGTGQSLYESHRHTEVNVSGTAQMLDAFIRHQIVPLKMILLSSRAVYGEGRWKYDADGSFFYPGARSKAQLKQKQWDFPRAKFQASSADKNMPYPVSVYGATKLAQENLMSIWSAAYEVDFAILRLQNVYGPGQSLINDFTGIVPLFVRMALDGKSIPLYEDGLIIRDFVYVDDVAEAIIKALENKTAAGTILDVGSGKPITLMKLAVMISEQCDAPLPEVCGEYRLGDVRHAAATITKTRKKLNWEPRTPLNQGIEVLCRWVKQETMRMK